MVSSLNPSDLIGVSRTELALHPDSITADETAAMEAKHAVLKFIKNLLLYLKNNYIV